MVAKHEPISGGRSATWHDDVRRDVARWKESGDEKAAIAVLDSCAPEIERCAARMVTMAAAHIAGMEKADCRALLFRAMLDAMRTYEPQRNVRFFTHAATYLRVKAVNDMVRASGMIHIPAHCYVSTIKRREPLGDLPSVQGGFGEARQGEPISADHPWNRARVEGPESGVLARERRTILWEFLARHLTERQVEILLWTSEGETLSAVGIRLGISRERVRQLKESAMEKARSLETEARAEGIIE